MWTFATLVLGFVGGVIITLTIQWYFIRRYFTLPPSQSPETPNFNQQEATVVLPEELLKLLDSMNGDMKESCLSLNLIFQFLFNELHDTSRVRRWFIKKLSVEFEELLQGTTTGKLLEQITIQDLHFGAHFPLVKSLSVKNVQMHNAGNIQELDVELDLEYNGGFQLSISADMVLGRSAFLSVRVTRLQGQAQLRFTRVPYTHWSFAFCEEPQMDLQVESHFQGRPLPKVTSLIVSQIRRTVRKRHTLPNYKIRYKPFFLKPEPPLSTTTQSICLMGNKLTEGVLEVTAIQCSRLFPISAANETFVYCTLAVDSTSWVDVASSCNSNWMARDIDLARSSGQPIGITFKQDDDSTTSGSHGAADDDCDDSGSTDSGSKGSPAIKSPLSQSPIKRSSLKSPPAVNAMYFERSKGALDVPPSLSKVKPVESTNSNKVPLKSTATVKFVEDPKWKETIIFEVGDNNKFLNLCVWHHVPDQKAEKQDKNCRSEKDTLLGHISILLVDVATECAFHRQGFYRQTFQLLPPEPKPVASRNLKLSRHPGFDESQCYGDVTLAFTYKPKALIKETQTTTEAFVKDNIGMESEDEGFSILPEILEDESQHLDHDFIITQFNNTVFCKFCGKKVWLKLAFQCRCCTVVCHKKCVTKFQAATSCSREGIKLKTGTPAPQPQPEIITTHSESSYMGKSVAAEESESSKSVLESPRTQRRLRSLLSNLASSTKNCSVNISRAGSVHNLAIPSQQPLSSHSKSLPPSPQGSPGPSRKTSLQGGLFQAGPDFEIEEDLEIVIQRLLQYSNDEMLVSVAKEKGRDLFANLSLSERKDKLNAMIAKLQLEIDLETENRNLLSEEERRAIDLKEKTRATYFIAKSNEKIQALAVLMLYYCSGLQHCHEIDESLKLSAASLVASTSGSNIH